MVSFIKKSLTLPRIIDYVGFTNLCEYLYEAIAFYILREW